MLNNYFCIKKCLTWSDQIRSVAQSCPTLCDPMNRSTPGLPVHHQLLEFTETSIESVMPSSHLGAWWATVHGLAKSWTWLSDYHIYNLLFHHLVPVSVPPPPYLFSLSFHKLPRNFPWRDKQQLHSHLQFLCYPETHLILIKIFSAHLLSLPGSIPSQKRSLAIPVSPTTFILTPC